MKQYDHLQLTIAHYFERGWPNECVEWHGSCTSDGYGQVRHGKLMLKAHKESYRRAKGDLPQGEVVRHVCNNPKCFNADHLTSGTVQDNSDDMVRAGRQAKGEKNGRAVVSAEDVEEIRIIREDEGLSYRALGELYGIGISQVFRICKGESWNG